MAILLILLATHLSSVVIPSLEIGEDSVVKLSEELLDKNVTFEYHNCADNFTYPANIMSLVIDPYPIDFTRSMKIIYKIALRKNLITPAGLIITFNFGFIRYQKELDLCSELENELDMQCPLQKQLYQGYYRFSLRPYQYIGKNLDGVWAKVMVVSGDDEAVFMCIKFRIKAKTYNIPFPY